VQEESAGGLRIGGALATLMLVALVSRATTVNPATVGFLFLIVVLFAATWGGLAAGVWASVAAALLFSLFLPPLDNPHIADPENWIAFATFLTTAVLASRLVTRARAQAERAELRASEMAAMNALAVDVLAGIHDLPALAGRAAEALVAAGARAGGVLLYDGDATRTLAWRGSSCPPYIQEKALRLRGSFETVELASELESDFLVPLVEQGGPIGILACVATAAPRSAVESVAKVLNLALQRERLLSERVHVEALRESEALKTALVRAVSHDLSTPLTAIGFLVDALKRKMAGQEALPTVVELETEAARLRRRIDGLLALGRLEAGSVVPRPEPVPPADLFRSARESLSLMRRPLEVRIEPDCPELFADPYLALEILVNLLENADRASAEGVAIELVAAAEGDAVRLGVLDHGHGLGNLPPGRQAESSDARPRGLGLEIARRFAAASGGSVAIEARPEGGVAAWLRLPAAPLVVDA
jgi:two-component system sensor histidine kinase KdpD